MRIDNGKDRSILNGIGRVIDDYRIYVCKTNKGWYRLYRQGQRSWDAVCFVPSQGSDHEHGYGVSIHGNANTIMQKVEDTVEVKEWHLFVSETEYRKAVMAIVATGEIDGVLDVQIIKKKEEES